jgi:hypothetical protein
MRLKEASEKCLFRYDFNDDNFADFYKNCLKGDILLTLNILSKNSQLADVFDGIIKELYEEYFDSSRLHYVTTAQKELVNDKHLTLIRRRVLLHCQCQKQSKWEH